jgi:hypothetical protein
VQRHGAHDLDRVGAQPCFAVGHFPDGSQGWYEQSVRRRGALSPELFTESKDFPCQVMISELTAAVFVAIHLLGYAPQSG